MNSDTLIWPAVFLGMYLFLESLDWGLSLAAPFVARNQEENKAVRSLLKPGIDLNEAWLIFGLSLVASAVPAAAGGAMHDSVMAVLSVAVVGGALRILAAFFKNVFGSALILKGMSLYSVLALFVIGLSGGAMVTGGNLMSGVGIVISLWLILAFFQLATLYGAVKIVNPLGERCRAAFLVSSILQLVFFLGMAFLLKGDIADGPLSGFFWIGLAVSSVLSIAAFFLARMRRTIVALAALYISTFFSVSLYAAGLSSKLQGASTPDPMVMAVITGWTVAVLLWRLYRKRVDYEWKDHI